MSSRALLDSVRSSKVIFCGKSNATNDSEKRLLCVFVCVCMRACVRVCFDVIVCRDGVHLFAKLRIDKCEIL